MGLSKASLLTLLEYKKKQLLMQKEAKTRYRLHELECVKDGSGKRKQGIAQAVQANLRHAMRETQKEILKIKTELSQFYTK